MFLRIGVCGGLLLIVAWAWRSEFGAVSFEGREPSLPEDLRLVGMGAAVQGFSLGLVRSRALLETRRYNLPFFAWLGYEKFAEGSGISISPNPSPPVTPDLAVEILRRKVVEFG
ncbi:MAG: hypothetical protein GWQ05_06655 [Verrucomicrobiaceae bacterium]|nr:hypothetical protein [Verrucomicrobiaceae bacterium]